MTFQIIKWYDAGLESHDYVDSTHDNYQDAVKAFEAAKKDVLDAESDTVEVELMAISQRSISDR